MAGGLNLRLFFVSDAEALLEQVTGVELEQGSPLGFELVDVGCSPGKTAKLGLYSPTGFDLTLEVG